MPRSRPNVAPQSRAIAPAPAHDALGIVCCGALAFVTSSIAHEAIGHGGTTLLSGAKITLLSSVFFKATNGGSMIDAGGPLMNYLLAGIAAVLLRRNWPASVYGKLLLITLVAVNLFWGFGYFLYSGITQKGDWAFLFASSDSAWVWRIVLIVVGAVGYMRSTTAVRRMLLPFAEISRDGIRVQSLFRTSLLLYLAAGATCCGAALFYRGPVGPAIHESALESFGGFIGLGTIALRKVKEASNRSIIPPSNRWRSATVIIVIAFISTFGRGYFG